MECFDIVHSISQMPQGTSQPGCSQNRLGSVKPQSNMSTPGLQPTAEFDTSPLLKAMPVEPVSFYPCLEPQFYQHIDFGFERRHGDSCWFWGGIHSHIVILDIISWWKAICLPILLCFIIFLILVTKLWDIIIRLCMCKGRTHYVRVLESKSCGKPAKIFDFYLQITVKWQSISYISDQIHKQIVTEWCHTYHWKSGQFSWQICLNNDHDAAFIHWSNSTTLGTHIVYIIEIVEIAYGTSWRLRRRRMIRKDVEVELYSLKTSEMIYMAQIASRKCGNIIGPRHLSLT